MRPLELAFLASLLLAGVALFLAPSRRPALLRYRPALPVTLALLHVLLEQGRWQLFPAYALAGVLSLLGVLDQRRREAPLPDRAWRRRIGGLLTLAVTGATAAIASLLPVFSLPRPTGTFQVGTRWMILSDSTRLDDLAPAPGARRRVVVRLWFPADSVSGDPDAYIEDPVARAIATGLGLPRFVLSHLSLTSTHSHRRARLAATPARLPLILFSHGYAIGTESQNTVQMEELASHGFVVASLDHLHEAAAVVMPGGDVVPARLPFDPLGDTAVLRQSQAGIRRLQQAADTTALRTVLDEMYALAPALQQSIVRWRDDTHFVLGRLAALGDTSYAGADSLFVGRVDTDRVGLLGMSFGGATAAAFCVHDERCAAGMNLDGLLYGDAAHQALTRPFFFASSEANVAVHRLFHERAAAPSWLASVRGATHMDYTDFNWFAPRLSSRLGMTGDIAPARMHAIMNALVVGFFDAALRHGPPLDEAALRQRFPELSIASREGRASPADSTAR